MEWTHLYVSEHNHHDTRPVMPWVQIWIKLCPEFWQNGLSQNGYVGDCAYFAVNPRIWTTRQPYHEYQTPDIFLGFPGLRFCNVFVCSGHPFPGPPWHDFATNLFPRFFYPRTSFLPCASFMSNFEIAPGYSSWDGVDPFICVRT